MLQPKKLFVGVSVTSVTNVRGDNEIILGAVHRSPGICHTAVENPKESLLLKKSIDGLHTWFERESYYAQITNLCVDKKCINKEERVRHLPGYCP